ncbi:MAG: flavodoxin domain-containing protein [Pseudomonadota bacterium]
MQIRLLYGTETGTAEILCDDLKDELDGEIECEVQSLEDMGPADLSTDALNVFVVATTGSGDLPFTAIPFFDKLQAEKPDLSNIQFAIFGLGDKTFAATYNFGSQTVMDKLLELNAKQVGARGMFDASGNEMPEEVAMPWLRETLEAASVS